MGRTIRTIGILSITAALVLSGCVSYFESSPDEKIEHLNQLINSDTSQKNRANAVFTLLTQHLASSDSVDVAHVLHPAPWFDQFEETPSSCLGVCDYWVSRNEEGSAWSVILFADPADSANKERYTFRLALKFSRHLNKAELKSYLLGLNEDASLELQMMVYSTPDRVRFYTFKDGKPTLAWDAPPGVMPRDPIK